MRVALALLALAGCGSDAPGMRLDVRDGGTGAVRVELYLAREKCSECSDIQPAIAQQKLHGEGYLLDGSAMTGTPETALAMDGGRAVFELRAPAATDVTLPVVLAIGLDAQGKVVAAEKLTDVTIPASSTVWWKLDLEPATDAVASDARMPVGQRVQIWRRNAPDVAACVDYERADGSAPPKRTWLVPEDDLDCDEFPPATDCDKVVYHAMGNASINAARCVTDQYPVPKTQGPTCLLGGNACVDGTPAVNTTVCARVDPYYCVPDALCTNTSCRGAPVQCAIAGLLTEVQCDVPFDAQTGAPCGSNSSSTLVQLDSFFLQPSNQSDQVKCDDVNFADLSFAKPILSKMVSRGMLALHASSVSSNATCAFTLTYDHGEDPGIGVNILPLATFADLQLSNERHVLLPFVFEFHAATDCMMADGMRCTPVPLAGETLANCTAPGQ